MKGVESFFDENDEPRAVLIDIRKNSQIWKSFRDVMLTDKEPPKSNATKRGEKTANAKKANGRPEQPSGEKSDATGVAGFFEVGERVRRMNGVEFLFDKEGNPKAVWLDLHKEPELWEDFCDILMISKRQGERTYSLAEVEKHLRRLGKLK